MKLIGLFLIVVSCSTIAQNSSEVIKVEFNSLTRGFQESIVITKDSITFTKLQVGEVKINKTRGIKKEEWSGILKSLQVVALSEIDKFASPTSKRSYDGARSSTITISTGTSQQYSHSFDNEDPHEKLNSLMALILKMKKGFK